GQVTIGMSRGRPPGALCSRMGVDPMADNGRMTVREILALPVNTQVSGQFLVRECEVRGSEGRYFLRLLLGDRTGVIHAYVWNYDINQKGPKVGDVARLQGIRGEF